MDNTFAEQKHSDIFFYLLATADRNEKINRYLSSVHRKPFTVDRNYLGEEFNTANIKDRSAIVSYMTKVAHQSSQNLKRNADALLSSIAHDTIMARRKKSSIR